jgi:hypothetical protein
MACLPNVRYLTAPLDPVSTNTELVVLMSIGVAYFYDCKLFLCSLMTC